MKLDEKLVCLRKEKGLTQLELAEVVKVSRQAVSKWEVGVAVPSTENLKALSELYKVSLDYLLNDGCEDTRQPGKVEQKKQTQLSKRRICVIVIVCIIAVVVSSIYIIYSVKDLEKSPISTMESETWDNTGAKDFALDW